MTASRLKSLTKLALLLGLPVALLLGLFGGGVYCGHSNRAAILGFERDWLGMNVEVPGEPGKPAPEKPTSEPAPPTRAEPPKTEPPKIEPPPMITEATVGRVSSQLSPTCAKTSWYPLAMIWPQASRTQAKPPKGKELRAHSTST